MSATIYLLFAIAFFNGEPQVIQKAFSTDAECQTAKTQLTTEAVGKGATDGSVNCFVVKVGKLS